MKIVACFALLTLSLLLLSETVRSVIDGTPFAVGITALVQASIAAVTITWVMFHRQNGADGDEG